MVRRRQQRVLATDVLQRLGGWICEGQGALAASKEASVKCGTYVTFGHSLKDEGQKFCSLQLLEM